MTARFKPFGQAANRAGGGFTCPSGCRQERLTNPRKLGKRAYSPQYAQIAQIEKNASARVQIRCKVSVTQLVWGIVTNGIT